MKIHSTEKSDFSQSAVDGVQAGGNISFGSIYQNQVTNYLLENDTNEEAIKDEYRRKIGNTEDEYRRKVGYAESEHRRKVDNAEGEHRKKVDNIEDEYRKKIDNIEDEYRKKVDELKGGYKADVRAAQADFYLDVKACRKHAYDTTQEEYIGIKDNWFYGLTMRELEREVDQDEADMIDKLALAGLSIWDAVDRSKVKERMEKIKSDIDILDELIYSLNQIRNLNPLSISNDSILNESLFDKLHEETREKVEELRTKYIDKRCSLEEEFNFKLEEFQEEKDTKLEEFQEEKDTKLQEFQEEKYINLEQCQREKNTKLEECQKERDIKIYGHHLKRFLKQDGYPLELESLNFLQAYFRENDLDKEDVVVIEEKLIEPYCRGSLDIYKQACSSKLDERFPLDEDASFEIEELKKKLGLEDFDFLRLKAKLVFQELVKPFYQESFKKYRELYKSRLEQEGLALSQNTISNLESIKKSSGLKSYYFDDLIINKIEQELMELVYRENVKEYEQQCKQKLEQEGFPFSPTTVIELNCLENTLSLKDFQFPGCPEIGLIKKELIEPFYKDNLQPYGEAYKQKLRKFGVSFAQSNTAELEKLRRDYGFDLSYLEDLNLQDIFNLDEISKIEQELIELTYRENVKEYEQQCKQKLEQEGFPFSPTTVIELNCLENTLSLRDFQFPGCPEIGLIKKELIEPFYKDNLQPYGEAYKQKLRKFGVSFAQSNTAELEKLRRDYGFDLSYLEDLNLQDILNLDEISKIEQELIELTYRENFENFEIEYRNRFDKEGFSLSYSTISELDHLEEILGLRSFQTQESLELKSIKAKWANPFYQKTLQNYRGEYKRKLYQFGLDFSRNHVPELEELRSRFGLTPTHLKNLKLQDQSFQLETDLFAVEKAASEIFYSEVLQHYRQDLKKLIESSSLFVGQDEDLEESLIKLGIRSEDIKVVTGLTRNDWEIDHLFYELDSNVSYWKLITCLAGCEWQAADALTRDLLLKLSDRRNEGFLDKESIEKVSARDVYTLDRLWVEYSKGHFGFSVQKQIFEKLDRKKQLFAEAVGWSKQDGVFRSLFAWKSYDDLDFTINAPQGHLPIWRVKSKEISADNFFHLKTWNFKENEPGLGEFVTEVPGQNWSNNDGSRPDPSTTNILSQSFWKIFESINQFEIKQKVDQMGIDGFINQCAILAATTGAAIGLGGFATMIVGVPFDVLNNVLQQFRVTLGVIYYKKGVYKVSFTELINIVGLSIGVEVGATLTKSVMINLANKILVYLSASVAGKAVPFLGAAIGGSVNYGFVKTIGAAVKRIDMSSYTFQSERAGGEIEGQ